MKRVRKFPGRRSAAQWKGNEKEKGAGDDGRREQIRKTTGGSGVRRSFRERELVRDSTCQSCLFPERSFGITLGR